MYQIVELIKETDDQRGVDMLNVDHIQLAFAQIEINDKLVKYVLYNAELEKQIIGIYQYNAFLLQKMIARGCHMNPNSINKEIKNKELYNAKLLAYKSGKQKSLFVLGDDEVLEEFCRKFNIEPANFVS